MATRFRFLDAYLALVTVTGGSLVFLFAASAQLHVASQGRGFWLFALLLLVGEVFPISVPRRGGEVDELTASTTFAFALLIGFGTPAAVIVQVFASVIADLIVRKSVRKAAFNVGQYALSLGLAGTIYEALGGGPSLGTAALVPFLVAAVVFFVLNTVITDIAVCLTEDVPFWPYISKDLFFQVQATLPLVALAPVVVAAADVSLWLVPLAAAPAIAVWWGTRLALENAALAQRLQGSLDQEKELNRLKDEFVAVVSHELRTPLTSVQGYIKTMLQLADDLPDDQRRSFLEAADRQSDRLRRLIEQLLVVGRLEAHVEPLALSSVVLDRLVGHVVDELRPRAHGHTFDVRIPDSLHPMLTDEGKLHQILSNLVENALKYAPPDTRVTVSAEPAVSGVVLSVADEGAGIPEDAQERIFERFFQVDQSATRRVGGTGLGLYICNRMAESIGGRLWLARSDGEGSAFSLFVPSTPPQADGAPDEGIEEALSR